MPVVGDNPVFGLPPASRGQREGPRDHGAYRSAVPGSAVLRLAADGGVAGDPGPCRQPQAGAAPDALAGLVAILQRPNTSKPAVGRKIYPYLLDGLSIERGKLGAA